MAETMLKHRGDADLRTNCDSEMNDFKYVQMIRHIKSKNRQYRRHTMRRKHFFISKKMQKLRETALLRH